MTADTESINAKVKELEHQVLHLKNREQLLMCENAQMAQKLETHKQMVQMLRGIIEEALSAR